MTVRSATSAASFRDPAAQVFFCDGRVFRAIDSATNQALKALEQKGILSKWAAEGKIVSTKWVTKEQFEPAELPIMPDTAAFLEHEFLSFISYPSEWSLSMLADAALLTLDLQIALISEGYSLKDASAYNIQFRRGKPLFIDISSIEKPERLDLWYALGQFQRMFLFPLLLLLERGIDLRSYFLSHLDGWPLEQVVRSFQGLGKWKPSLLLDLTLPAMLDKRSRTARAGSGPRKNSGGPEAQLINLRRIRGKICKLAQSYKTSSEWSGYTQTCTYGNEAETFKKRVVREFLVEKKPARVLDLGCNTGEYTRIAAESGAEVLAADADHDAVELLYRDGRDKGRQIHPLVLDLANPTPAIGYLNRERSSFLERGRSNCVLALALIHHLHVSANFPLSLIAELFDALTSDYLVLEFVPREDEMFQRLIQFRRDIYAEYTLENCISSLASRFRLLGRESIPGTHRTLLLLQKQA
jgi:SAM-dependent methyltransferase